jgi:hypothetical protein
MLHKRIRFVTANYYQLQGFRLVPFGIFALLVRASYRGWFDWLPGRPVHEPGGLGVVWGPLAFVAAIACALTATAYYRKRYGAVAPNGRGRRNWLLGLAIISFFALAQIDARVAWPISLSSLLVSASLGITVWADGWARAHYLFGAVAWLAVSIMPAFHPDLPTALLAYDSAIGLTLIVCGIGDHLLITRTLGETGRAIDASNATAL